MTENDAVSRKWLLDRYDAEHQGPPGRARELIESAPPVDAVKHSYWITYSTTHFSKKDGSERKHNEYLRAMRSAILVSHWRMPQKSLRRWDAL